MELGRIDTFRVLGLFAAAQEQRLRPDEVIRRAGEFAEWLGARPARIRVGPARISDQSAPALTHPARREPGMPTVMTDGQQATYPAAEAEDSKGFQVADTVTLTTDDDTAQAVAARTDNADGSTKFVAVAPGVITLTWSDGNLTTVDTLQVTPGGAAQIVVGSPVVEDQPAPAGG